MSATRFVISDDAETIARLHWQSWQASYRGILPDDYLDNEVIVERRNYWRQALATSDYWLVLVAIENDRPVGFIALKKNVDEGYDATIEHLHVDPQMKGRGLGRQLIGQAVSALVKAGMASVCLWVFDSNTPAIGFYEKLGGRTDKFGVDKFAGSNAPDRRIGWHDPEKLAGACAEKDKP
jgi:ribosomal protein S18 acetylase RimI-like enzyme